MNKKKYFLVGMLALTAVLTTGCFKKENNVVPQNNTNIESGEIEAPVVTDENTYGNGKDAVYYKGNIYYIEYRGNDFAEEAIRDIDYYINTESNNQRYLNKIDKKGNITNLFKVTGSTFFSIVDDRFYLKASNGLLYTVDMNGENGIDLIKGDYIGFDIEGHAVYYQSSDDQNTIIKIDTKDLSIKQLPFGMPYKKNLIDYDLNQLAVKNGKIYYSKFDNKTTSLELVEYDIAKNETNTVATYKTELMGDYEFPDELDRVALTETMGDYSGVAIGYPCSGTMRGYYAGDIYLFDLAKKTIAIAKSTDNNAMDHYFNNYFYDEINKLLYKLNFDRDLPDVETYITEDSKERFATRHQIDLKETLGDEALNSGTTSPDTPKYEITLEHYDLIGDKLFYTVTLSRANPANEVGWRPAFIRIASEVYCIDLATNNKLLVYTYANNNYEKLITSILGENNAEASGEKIVYIDEKEELKEDEMYLEIKVDNIWKDEFDVKVEEVGGGIIGKRIEYEGHHKKADGTIKIKVSKEVGAMLTVFIDNDRQSQMVIEESM